MRQLLTRFRSSQPLVENANAHHFSALTGEQVSRRTFRAIAADALIGAVAGGGIGLLLASWIVVLMVFQAAVQVRMRHGATLHGGWAIAAFCIVGVLAGVTMSTLRPIMRHRAVAFGLGALWCGVLVASLSAATTGIDVSWVGKAVVNGSIALGLGGYAGLQVREGLMRD